MFTIPPPSVTPSRVHLIDAHPRGAPTNFLFRGNNPVTNGTFNFTGLLSVLRAKAAGECGVMLPDSVRFDDRDLENPTDPGFGAERAFWRQHPELGSLEPWPTLGSVLEVKRTPAPRRQELVANGSWAVQGHADYLASRLEQTRALLANTSGPPTVLFAHCNAGCDRTGEVVGSYRLKFHPMINVTQMYALDVAECGRPPNYWSTMALEWFCIYMQENGRGDLTGCTDFAKCKFAGKCTPT